MDFMGGPALQNYNSRWRQPQSWISSVAHNSFTVAHICTKFDTLEVLDTGMPKY